MELSFSKTSAGTVPILAVSGEVDVYSAPALKDKIEALGMRVRVADTMMRNDQDKQRLAHTTLEFVDELAISGRH